MPVSSGANSWLPGADRNLPSSYTGLQSHNAGLENNAQFKAMSKLVNEPDDLFVYFDAKTGFESLYDASRTMLVFGVALIPLLNKYIDAMAFPETSEISKHLSPIVLSRHRVPRGVLDESVGPDNGL